MNNDLYQHEAVQQLAVEFGLPKMTDKDVSEDEIVYFPRGHRDAVRKSGHPTRLQYGSKSSSLS